MSFAFPFTSSLFFAIKYPIVKENTVLYTNRGWFLNVTECMISKIILHVIIGLFFFFEECFKLMFTVAIIWNETNYISSKKKQII